MSAPGWPRGFGSGPSLTRSFTGLDSNHGSTDDLRQSLLQAQTSQQSPNHRFRSPALHRVSSLFSLGAASATSDHGFSWDYEDQDEQDNRDDAPQLTPLDQITFGDEIGRAPENIQPPCLLQIVESLQSAMMTRRNHAAAVPREYNAHISVLIEGFGHINRRLEKTESELADLKQLREKELEEFRGLSEEWNRQTEEYKAEIKRLELVLARESKDGVASVVVARSNTLIDRSGTKRFQARLKRLSTSRDTDEDMDTRTTRYVPLRPHTQPKTIDNIPRIIDHRSDIRLSRVVREMDSPKRPKRRARLQSSHTTDTGQPQDIALSPSRPSVVPPDLLEQHESPVLRDAHTPYYEAPDKYHPSAEELLERAERRVDSSSSSGSCKGTDASRVVQRPSVQGGSQVQVTDLYGVPSGYVAGLGLRTPGEDNHGSTGQCPAPSSTLNLTEWLAGQQSVPDVPQHCPFGVASVGLRGSFDSERAGLDDNGAAARQPRSKSGPRRPRGFSFKAGDDVLPTSPIASTQNSGFPDSRALPSNVGVSHSKATTTQFLQQQIRLPSGKVPASGSELVSPTVGAQQKHASTTSTVPTGFSSDTWMSAAKERQGAAVRQITNSESTGSVIYVGRESTESSGSSQAATQEASSDMPQRSGVSLLRRELDGNQTNGPLLWSNSQVFGGSSQVSSRASAGATASFSPSTSANAMFAPTISSNRPGSKRESSWSSAGTPSSAKGGYSPSPSRGELQQSRGATEAARIAANVAVTRRSQRDSIEE